MIFPVSNFYSQAREKVAPRLHQVFDATKRIWHRYSIKIPQHWLWYVSGAAATIVSVFFIKKILRNSFRESTSTEKVSIPSHWKKEAPSSFEELKTIIPFFNHFIGNPTSLEEEEVKAIAIDFTSFHDPSTITDKDHSLNACYFLYLYCQMQGKQLQACEYARMATEIINTGTIQRLSKSLCSPLIRSRV